MAGLVQHCEEEEEEASEQWLRKGSSVRVRRKRRPSVNMRKWQRSFSKKKKKMATDPNKGFYFSFLNGLFLLKILFILFLLGLILLLYGPIFIAVILSF